MATLLESLKTAGLHPGPASVLIPESFQPETDLHVSFGAVKVDQGNLFRVSQVQDKPSLSWNSQSGASYLFMLVDPDAPTPADPKFAFWRHWVITGAKDESTQALTEYLAPGPKADSAPHRYLFLLFREPAGLALQQGDVGGSEFVDRRSFAADKFIEKHGLELVGLNWMRCAADDWTK